MPTRKERGIQVRDITAIAVIAAMYAAITWLVAPLAYGPLQCRISEILKPLALRGRRYIIGLALGVFVANLGSPYAGPWELVVMPLAALVGGEMAYRLRAWPLMAISAHAIWVGLVVGGMLHAVAGVPFGPCVAWVAISEIAVTLVGWRISDRLLRRAR